MGSIASGYFFSLRNHNNSFISLSSLQAVPFFILPNKVTQNVELFVEALEDCRVTRLFAVTSLVRNILSFVSMESKRNFSKVPRLSEVFFKLFWIELQKTKLFYFRFTNGNVRLKRWLQILSGNSSNFIVMGNPPYVTFTDLPRWWM